MTTNPLGREEIAALFPLGVKEIGIIVKDKTGKPVNMVNLYTAKSGTVPVERASYEHCIDMEGELLHAKGIKNTADSLWPRFNINNGLFYSYKLTDTTFTLTVDPKAPKKTPRQIAIALAADIFLGSDDVIEILGDGASLSPPLILTQHTDPDDPDDLDAVEYEIGITNSCVACSYDPSKAGATEENDFRLYYEALSTTEAKFMLIAEKPFGPDTPPKLGRWLGSKRIHPFTDRSPCMAIIFGQTRAFK